MLTRASRVVCAAPDWALDDLCPCLLSTRYCVPLCGPPWSVCLCLLVRWPVTTATPTLSTYGAPSNFQPRRPECYRDEWTHSLDRIPCSTRPAHCLATARILLLIPLLSRRGSCKDAHVARISVKPDGQRWRGGGASTRNRVSIPTEDHSPAYLPGHLPPPTVLYTFYTWLCPSRESSTLYLRSHAPRTCTWTRHLYFPRGTRRCLPGCRGDNPRRGLCRSIIGEIEPPGCACLLTRANLSVATCVRSLSLTCRPNKVEEG